MTPEEVRVLGVLAEKQLSTPDYYPMTVNALISGCNQKTNREPVVAYGESEVLSALEGLQRARLVGIASVAGSRTDKYRHALQEALALDDAAVAVLAMLLLRGPQTVGEIRGRTTRLHTFDDLDAVAAVLEAMQQADPPLVTAMARQPGQKEERYAHLLSPPPEPEEGVALSIASPGNTSRLDDLEAEVETLKDDLARLREAFDAFRSQFE